MSERYKNLSAQSAKNAGGVLLRNISTELTDGDEIAMFGTLTEQKGTKPSAHRSSVSSADTGDISSASGALDIGNSINVACYVDFDDPSVTTQIALALFDSTGDLIGVTEFNTFASDASWRDGASGPYVSPRYVFDVAGASQVLAKVKSLTTNAVINIFLVTL